MVINARRARALLILLLFVIAGVFGVRQASGFFYRQSYPREYGEYVSAYAQQYGVDPNFVFAVIKTESGFRPDATSSVGARGLMQIMEDTFHWVDTKIPKDETFTGDSYEDMYSPEENIRYGTFLLAYLHREFGSYQNVAAAYHAGRSAVGKWLRSKEYSSDGNNLDKIPIKDTEHYVNKVMKAYEMYSRLYPPGE